MHLKAIKLRGFKSFVDPVEVHLESGVAVVIGPNGSGKSNVSDSILWATGSLSPHELRAEKPDDVLFAGSADRKPVDFCEVELIFDNEDGAWPELPFSEVSLTRRLHRGGEGQYLVNRTAVRRIDLIELLSDVGLGGGLRSVISQGSVESVLGAKPAERRSLIEEAAGLGKFKHRRHRAELKLARVATQVERARDLEDEVRKRLRPLALQATAAERAEKLGEEIARLRAAVATLDLARLKEHRAGAEARRDAALAKRQGLAAKLEELLAARASAEEELTDAAGTRENATSALYGLRAGAERIALRREAAQALVGRFREELDAAKAYDPASSSALQDAAREAASAAQAAVATRARLQVEAEERWARVVAHERVTRAAIAADVEEALATRALAESELADGGHRSLLALRGVAQAIEVRHESTHRFLEQITSDLSASRDPDAHKPAELGRAADEADEAARLALRERDDLAARTELARERLVALEQALAEREGLTPAARALAEEGEQLAFSQIDVPAGSERAVAAALGHRASALVAADAASGLRLVERARAAGLGSVLVLVGRDPQKLVSELPVVPEHELLASKVPAVTEDGIGWDPDRGELWFAGEAAEAVLLELEARRRSLAVEVDDLAGRAAAAAQSAERASERARAAAAALAPVAHLRSVRVADATLLERIRSGAVRLDESLRVAATLASRFETPLAERASSVAGELREAAARETELRRALGEVDLRITAAERHANSRSADATGELALLRSEAEALLLEVAEAGAAAEQASSRASAAARLVAEAGGGRSGRPSTIVLERLVADGERLLQATVVDVNRFEAPLKAQVAADAARTSELGAELRRLGAEEAEFRNASSAASEAVSAIDVELARTDAERDEAQRRLEAAGAEPAEGENRDELADRVLKLEARREQLGQVNPLAKEEYEAEKERLDELAVQRADLEKSLEELEQLRRELTETVERRFAETFEAVEHHFHAVAATLFPGGEGRLRMTEPGEDGEEPGIEVELRPAGKRVTRLSLLSGGEKALGAIAFLFSLFLARPSPFYLLDEVEAALDDANIGRFTELLRTYADRAQFIVITHQKRTMEAADVLYGVTMGPNGVSQIVSRRLPQEESAAISA